MSSKYLWLIPRAILLEYERKLVEVNHRRKPLWSPAFWRGLWDFRSFPLLLLSVHEVSRSAPCAQPYDAASHHTQNTKTISENNPCLFSHELPPTFCYSNRSWPTAYFCFHIRLHQWLYDTEYFSCRELQLRGILETFDNVKRRYQLLTLRGMLAFFLKNNIRKALRSSPMIAGTLNATRV